MANERGDWSVGYFWRSSDLIERAIFIGLALMLAYTVFVVIRFSRRYYLACRAVHDFSTDSGEARRVQSKFVADLCPGIGMLKGISWVSPFLGLAGTCYGIMAEAFVGFGTEKNAAMRALIIGIAASLKTAAAGMLAAIPATLSHDLIRARLETLSWRGLSSGRPAATGSSQEPFIFAQALPLRKPFSVLPHFAVLAAPYLVCALVVFMALKPYATPVGLPVRVLPIGPTDGDFASERIVFSVNASGNSEPVVRVNSKEVPWDKLEAVAQESLQRIPEPQAFVEADNSVYWAHVVYVVDMLERLHCRVVLLTTTPTRKTK